MVVHRLYDRYWRWLILALVPACEAAEQRPAEIQFVNPTVFEQTGALHAPRLRESSGVVASRQHPGYLWTHNDSGDDPVLYLTNLAGDDLGMLTLDGARARDWEDMTLAKCPMRDVDCLYIGDTGDNSQRRSTARLFFAPEPDSLPLPANAKVSARRVEIVYSDRPFNIEAIAATPDGHIWMVSKGLGDTAIFVFRIEISQLTTDSISVQPIFLLDFPPAPTLGQLVTGAAASPNGKVLAVRTYTQIFFYRIDGDRLERSGLCWLGHREPQGEAVDFLDDQRLVLTSESERGGVAPISVVSCPI